MFAVEELDGLFLDMPSVRPKDRPLIGPIYVMQDISASNVYVTLKPVSVSSTKIGAERDWRAIFGVLN